MKVGVKLSNEERRIAIIQSVRRVFAERGFHGTTTRALAEAAGVSEALLFKHFPTKEALFAAMKLACCTQKEISRFEQIKALEASASTLVLMVHYLVSVLVAGEGGSEDQAIQDRLSLRSLAEDGQFARHLLEGLEKEWIPKVEECLAVAESRGQVIGGPVRSKLGGWFAYNLAAMIKMQLLPVTPAVDYGMTRTQLVSQAVWFALRGMGLREEIIRQNYNPQALALFHI